VTVLRTGKTTRRGSVVRVGRVGLYEKKTAENCEAEGRNAKGLASTSKTFSRVFLRGLLWMRSEPEVEKMRDFNFFLCALTYWNEEEDAL
jgi:hypothetical protein